MKKLVHTAGRSRSQAMLFWLIPLLLLLENALYHFVTGGQFQLTAVFFLTDDIKATIFPVTLLFILVWRIERNKLRPQPVWLLLNAVLFAALIVVSILRSEIPTAYTQLVLVFRFILFPAVGFTALLSLVSPKDLTDVCWRERDRVQRFSVATLTVMFVLGFGSKVLWPEVVVPLGLAIKGLLMLTPFAATVKFDGTAAVSLIHPKFVLNVFSPCGGFEGLRFMALGLLVPLVLDHAQIGRRAPIYLAMAVPLVFLLNVVRITAMYSMGVIHSASHPAPEALQSSIDLFHNGSGALVYGFGITLFVLWIYRASSNRTPTNTLPV